MLFLLRSAKAIDIQPRRRFTGRNAVEGRIGSVEGKARRRVFGSQQEGGGWVRVSGILEEQNKYRWGHGHGHHHWGSS